MPAFERGSRVTRKGRRGRVESLDALTGKITITFDNGHVEAALAVDLEFAEVFKPRAPKPPAEE